MSSEELTGKQELFLEYLFNDPDCQRDTLKATVAAGYSPEQHRRLVRDLKDEILKRTNEELALNAPRAAKGLLDAMQEDGSIPKGDIRLKAVESVLDRVGMSKKQEMNVNLENNASPLFIIPEKKPVVLEDTSVLEDTNKDE